MCSCKSRREPSMWFHRFNWNKKKCDASILSLSKNHSSDMMLTCPETIPVNLPIEEKKSVFPANAEGSDSELKKLREDGYELSSQWQRRGWGRKGGSQRRNWEIRWRTKEGIGNSLAQDEIR